MQIFIFNCIPLYFQIPYVLFVFFAYAWAKTKQISNCVMMSALKSYASNQIKGSMYSFLNVGSSNCGLKSMNAICELLFDVDQYNNVELKVLSYLSDYW